jgi:hypothetical protein
VHAFLDAVDQDDVQFALVTFGDSVTHRVPLGADPAPIRAAIDELAARGGTNISAGVDAAAAILRAGRQDAQRLMIVLTDGVNGPGMPRLDLAAERAKDEGVTIVAVCAGGTCDPLLPQAASEPDFYFDVPDAADLVALFTRLVDELLESLRKVDITEVVAPGFELADASGGPPLAELGPDRFVWRIRALSEEGVDARHRLVARSPGRRPVARYTLVEYSSAEGLGRLYLPPAEVLVRGGPTPGPTALPPLASPTPGGPAPTSTPTPTEPSGRARLYLPLALDSQAVSR